MFEKEAKERAKDFTGNKERQVAYECGFLDGIDRANKELKEKLAGAERTRDNLRQIGFPTFQSCKEYADRMKHMEETLYCSKKTCDNCGFVHCENFQRQRKSEPCSLHISYKNRIEQLEKENAELKEKFNTRSCQNCKHYNKSCPNDGSCKHYSKWKGYENPQLTKAKEILEKLLVHSKRYVWIADDNNKPIMQKEITEAEQFLKEKS